MHALQAKVPEQLDKLNTIIKIYSDAHVGLISKWLVQSTDRADVPISEPEEWQYTHKHTCTDKRVHNPFLISTSHYLSLSDTSAYSLSLERCLTHTCTNILRSPSGHCLWPLRQEEEKKYAEIVEIKKVRTRRRMSKRERKGLEQHPKQFKINQLQLQATKLTLAAVSCI